MRIKAVASAVAVLAVTASVTAFAQGRMDFTYVNDLKWEPCDPKAAQPDACQYAYFRGDPEKQENYQMVKAKKGFVFPPHWHKNNEHLVVTKGTIVLAAEGGQEKDSIFKVGDYVYIPARRVHWGSCPEECVFYLNVDGPDSYIEAKDQRPE
jgi:quercetin dioxygenase-like cupin family protein